MARARQPIEPRLLASCLKMNEGQGCWIWTASHTRDGYGVLGIGRKQHRAHRAAYETWVGPIPEGALVCHRCDTPNCINPSHLFAGSHKDNTRDMHRKRRDGNRRMVDQSHPATKVTHADRARIRAMRARGHTLKSIAEIYGVTFQTISAIAIGSGSYGSR